MRDRFLILVAVLGLCAVHADARENRQAAGTAAGYQVVKVCPLVSVAEVKKFAPWAPQLDALAKAEEEALGNYGSSCNFPTVHVQVMSYRPQTIESAKKARRQDPVSGVGDEAYVANKRDEYAELIARVGPHLLTVQMDIGTGKTFDAVKPSLVELARLFVTKLRGK